MQKYGIRGMSLKWFENYLCSRSQFVNFNKYKSTEKNINIGVPQGSILGPLLFLLYVNDLSKISEKIFLLLFADDTSVFVSGKSVDTIIYNMNLELKKLYKWLYSNKLSLNIKKTHWILFSLKKKIKPVSNLYINNEVIERVDSTKFLGVILDSKMSWTNHINNVKVS